MGAQEWPRQDGLDHFQRMWAANDIVEWVFTEINGHPAAATFLSYLASDYFFGSNLYWICILQVAIISSASGYLCWCIKTRRGYWIWTDAALPLMLISAGHSFNAMWPVQIYVTTYFAAMVSLLGFTIKHGAQIVYEHPARVCAALFLMSYLGAAGRISATCLAAFIATFASVQAIRQPPKSWRPTLTLIGGHAILVALGLMWFFSYMTSTDSRGFNTTDLIRRVLLGMGNSIGHGAEPKSLRIMICIALASITALCASHLVIRILRRDNRNAWLLAFLAAAVAVVLALTFGRVSGQAPRFFSLLAPYPVILYVTASFCMPTRHSQCARTCLLTCVLVMAPYNISKAVDQLKENKDQWAAILETVAAGADINEVASRHSEWWHLGNEFSTRGFLRAIRERGIHPWSTLVELRKDTPKPAMLLDADLARSLADIHLPDNTPREAVAVILNKKGGHAGIRLNFALVDGEADSRPYWIDVRLAPLTRTNSSWQAASETISARVASRPSVGARAVQRWPELSVWQSQLAGADALLVSWPKSAGMRLFNQQAILKQ